MFSILAVVTLALAFISRMTRGAPLSRYEDLVTYLSLAASIAGLVCESALVKLFQLIALFTVGITIMLSPQIYFGMMVLSTTFSLAYAYGFFERNKTVKLVSIVVVAYVLTVVYFNHSALCESFTSVLSMTTFSIIFLIGQYFIFTTIIDKHQKIEEKIENEKQEYKEIAADAVEKIDKAIRLLKKEGSNG